jgi:protein-disulfide isomerase
MDMREDRVDSGAADRIAAAKVAARQRRWRRGGAGDPESLRYSPILWISILMLSGLTLSGLIVWYEMRHPPPPGLATPAGVTDDGGRQAGLTVGGTGSTTVEVYLDFSCVQCRAVDATTGPVLDQLAQLNRIRLVWHPIGSPGGAGYATQAANALACAADVGKLRPYADVLFANQPPAGSNGLTADQLIDIAGPVGLIQPSFAACVRDMRYRDWVAVGGTMAEQRGARAPSIYVDGRRLPQPTPDAIIAAIS